MGTMIFNFILGLVKTEFVKTIIAIGINKLLEHKTDGITSDLAKTLIDGIAKSKANPTKEDVFKDAINLLGK